MIPQGETTEPRILEFNSAMGEHNPRAYRYLDTLPDADRLSRTRSFVVYFHETVITRDEWFRPCHKVVRTEIARGLAGATDAEIERSFDAYR